MTPEQYAQFTEMLAANERMLSTLTDAENELRRVLRMHELARNAPGNQGVEEGRNPYFYGVQGADGQPGILVGDQTATPPFNALLDAEPARHWMGTVRIQSDAPFVWTHTLMTAAFQIDTVDPDVGNSSQFGYFLSVSGAGFDRQFVERMPRFDVGFTEAGSGRVLYQAQRFEPPEVTGQLVPSSLFDVMRLFQLNVPPTAQFSTSYTVADQGHGPSTYFENPHEVLLSANDVVEVSVRPLGEYNFFTDRDPTFQRISPRVFVTLLGYKLVEE